MSEKSDSKRSQDLILSSLLILSSFKLVWGILAMHIKFDFFILESRLLIKWNIAWLEHVLEEFSKNLL